MNLSHWNEKQNKNRLIIFVFLFFTTVKNQGNQKGEFEYWPTHLGFVGGMGKLTFFASIFIFLPRLPREGGGGTVRPLGLHSSPSLMVPG